MAKTNFSSSSQTDLKIAGQRSKAKVSLLPTGGARPWSTDWLDLGIMGRLHENFRGCHDGLSTQQSKYRCNTWSVANPVHTLSRSNWTSRWTASRFWPNITMDENGFK
ncbi:hypothetical protein PoB_004841600 [Plakobranchus ocellatus]|uniref:Uncharacterized protein n=1 Tax=Plakobranchus ocellatus TaxID=259542 RepID=A0AAV4BF26_9GAST|nr:hypothetical protein PoB_004841600 [Plakobranchus ocellatus]